MQIAIAQTSATNNLEANLAKMEGYVREAKSQGAELIAFPEMAYFSGKTAQWPPITSHYDVILGNFCALARSLNIAIIPGTLREPISNTDKCFNTLPFIDENGKILAEYRKIFLYKADLSDRSYDESVYCESGSSVISFPWKGFTLGLSICFDLRFPEVFRALKKKDAQIVFLPSAFTVPTGQAHWETLVRARAIENQYFMLAPGLTGKSGDGSEKYGNSIAFGPWGDCLGKAESEEGIFITKLSQDALLEASKKVNSWACRREDLFPI